MTRIFEVAGVAYTFPDGTPGLRDISIDVEAGERLAVLGPNGSGKSTLLHILDALIYPTSGSVRFAGRELSENAVRDRGFSHELRRRVAIVFQSSEAQLFSPTVRDEIAFGPRQYMPAPEVGRRVDECASKLAVSHLMERAPLRLSAGEKKRVALACAIANRPDVLLLDEPTAGLDPRSVRLLTEIIVAEHKAGVTIITATHDIHLVWEIADRVCLLGEDNRPVATGSVQEIMSDRDLLERHNLFHEHIHRHGDHWHAHEHEHRQRDE